MIFPTRQRFRLLALDIDGTLLDASGELGAETASAVQRAEAAGLRPVLCTGRRYRRALPVAQHLNLDAPLVCNSGALVKDPADGRTLWRADLDAALVAELLAWLAAREEPALSFTDLDPAEPDFLVHADPTGRPLFDDYLAQNRGHAGVDPGWTTRALAEPHFHLCAIGDRPAMLELEAGLHCALPGRLRTFVQRSPRYAGTMCEVLHPEASKWSAVLHLAALWGIGPTEIVAIGDDVNDIPMLWGAGLGLAMGHAPPSVVAAADRVLDPDDPHALARAVDQIIINY